MSRFSEIADDFQMLDGQERLGLLLEYADALPPLPERFHALRDAGMGRVHECQSPVFLHVLRQGEKLHVVADVPEEAPTARGFTAVLVSAFDGATPEEVAEAPADALHALGLDALLGMQRTRGLRAIYARLRSQAAGH